LSLVLGILTFFVVLAVLILAHELGHFTSAKLFGIRVEEFGLGFPPRVKTWWRNGTLYSLNAIPLGGFVKMLGENGDDHDPDSFGSKAPWKRLIVLAAGPSMNILLALAIFFFTYLVGVPDGLPVVTQVAPKSPAAAAGLERGDVIIAVDGHAVQYRSDLQADISARLGQHVTLGVLRGRRQLAVHVVPRTHPPVDQGAIGIGLAEDTTVSYSPAGSAGRSVNAVWGMVSAVPQLLQSVPKHGTSEVSGPIGIAHITTDAVGSTKQVGPSPIFFLLALLSANLGVLNLLPIPALDGGRILFVLISWVRRRNLDPEVEGLVHMVGMAVLLLLIAIISYQDLVRWIGGGS
jgi:regulator of sigma E protease